MYSQPSSSEEESSDQESDSTSSSEEDVAPARVRTSGGAYRQALASRAKAQPARPQSCCVSVFRLLGLSCLGLSTVIVLKLAFESISADLSGGRSSSTWDQSYPTENALRDNAAQFTIDSLGRGDVLLSTTASLERVDATSERVDATPSTTTSLELTEAVSERMDALLRTPPNDAPPERTDATPSTPLSDDAPVRPDFHVFRQSPSTPPPPDSPPFHPLPVPPPPVPPSPEPPPSSPPQPPSPPQSPPSPTPPPPSPPPGPSPPPSIPPYTMWPGNLTADKCDAMLRDDKHLFRRMWSAQGWTRFLPGRPACWDIARSTVFKGATFLQQEPNLFFDQALEGVFCETNWLLGAPEQDDSARVPTYDLPAPALLGFDDEVVAQCTRELLESGMDSDSLDDLPTAAQLCQKASYNVLQLSSQEVPYNLCRSLEWQVCAAKGDLPGQRGAQIQFTRAPADMDDHGKHGRSLYNRWEHMLDRTRSEAERVRREPHRHGLGKCTGFVPPEVGAKEGAGWSNDDVYFLEVCMFSSMCRNRHELFNVKAGQPFVCEWSLSGFKELQRILLTPPAIEMRSRTACVTPDDETDCQRCYEDIAEEAATCAIPGCKHKNCDLCTNDE